MASPPDPGRQGQGERWLPRLGPGKVLGMSLVSVVTAVLLAEAYAWLTPRFPEAWQAAAALHTGVSLVLAGWLWRRGRLAPVFDLTSVADEAPGWLVRKPWRAYLPALLVLGGTGVLIAASRQLGEPRVSAQLGIHWAWVSWVPLVEELTFRVGLGTLYRLWAPGLWGAWFEAVTFALAHGGPTLARLGAGEVGAPFGPFALALACEVLYLMTGRIAPAVALHMACNATVALFAAGDGRWLEWLDFFYL